MPEYVYGYAIREERLLQRAEEQCGVIPGENGYRMRDVLVGSFINLAKEAEVFGKVRLCHSEINGNAEIVMALASNNPRDILPTHPSLPDPSAVERLQAILATELPPRWFRTC